MLTELFIQNVAVIEKTSVSFGPGFNLFTGETGAGKSILIDAIGAVLGFRTSRDIVRTGADKAVVTALFDQLSPQTIAVLAENGYEPEEDGTLLLCRELQSSGKGTCKIGGRPATVSILREIAQTLINIHGQHDSQLLMEPERHMSLIDSYAATGELLAAYKKQYALLQGVRRELEALDMDEAEKTYRVDLLRYQIDEIESAALSPGEDDELSAQRKRLNNAAKIAESLAAADAALNGDDEAEGLVTLLDTAKDAAMTAGRYIESLSQTAQRMEEMYYELREYASDIHALATDTEPEGDVNAIENRLDLIYKLKHKYGATIEEVLARAEEARGELSAITHSEERKKELESSLAKETYAAQKLAEELALRRKEASGRFLSEVGEELKFLDMPFVRFELDSERCPLGPDGIDRMELLISTNPGEPPKPLAKIASGGELSRIMLSLKNVLADRDEVGTLIFDEVDTGVSGRAAQKIGQKLRQASQGRQIICVTHLAQVAAFAQEHLLIEKSVRGQRTFTEVRALDDEERVRELARIMGGEDITETVLQSAREMIERAQAAQKS